MCFVPKWVAWKNSGPEYRFLTTREPLRQPALPSMVGQLPFAAVQGAQGHYKVYGIVTNRDLPGEQVIWWYQQRCGKSAEAHGVLKEDLAGGTLPSGRFGRAPSGWPPGGPSPCWPTTSTQP